MPLNTADALAISNAITAQFDSGFMNTKIIYPDITEPMPTVRRNEKIQMVGNVPAMREFLGERIGKQISAWDIDTSMREWEQTIDIPRYVYEDDINNVYAKIPGELGERAAQQPDFLLLDMLNNGHQRKCWDGQNFFDANHVIEDSGAIANSLTSSVSVATLTSTQLRDAVVDAAIQMASFKDSKGLASNRVVEFNEANYTLYVPLNMAKQANEAYQATLIGNTSNVTLLRPRVRCLTELTDTRSFYLSYTGSRFKPFLFIPRTEIRREVKGLDSIETKDVRLFTEWRFNVEYAAYWNCIKLRFAA